MNRYEYRYCRMLPLFHRFAEFNALINYLVKNLATQGGNFERMRAPSPIRSGAPSVGWLFQGSVFLRERRVQFFAEQCALLAYLAARNARILNRVRQVGRQSVFNGLSAIPFFVVYRSDSTQCTKDEIHQRESQGLEDTNSPLQLRS